MNIEKITALLGQLQTITSLVAQLPVEARKEVEGMFKSNGLNLSLIGKDAVRVKQSLQAIPWGGFEALCCISTTHLSASTRSAIYAGETSNWGALFHPNEYGAFMHTGSSVWPQQTAPQCVLDAHRWARERGIIWLKFDADGPEVDELQAYGDGDNALGRERSVPTAAPELHAAY